MLPHGYYYAPKAPHQRRVRKYAGMEVGQDESLRKTRSSVVAQRLKDGMDRLGQEA